MLRGHAYGDALGVPYEGGCRPLPEMGAAGLFGGGLGGYEPGEWSDDTQMAICVAQAAEDEDLTTEAGLDAVADRFEAWYAAGPADIGIQTAQVLSDAAARSGPPASRLRAAASACHTRTGRSAGNGALMRTAPVSMALVGDPDAITAAARAIAELTHADPVAGDACVLWSLTIDSCLRITTSRPTPTNHPNALPSARRDRWATWIAAADHEPPGRSLLVCGQVTMNANGALSASIGTGFAVSLGGSITDNPPPPCGGSQSNAVFGQVGPAQGSWDWSGNDLSQGAFHGGPNAGLRFGGGFVHRWTYGLN